MSVPTVTQRHQLLPAESGRRGHARRPRHASAHHLLSIPASPGELLPVSVALRLAHDLLQRVIVQHVPGGVTSLHRRPTPAALPRLDPARRHPQPDCCVMDVRRYIRHASVQRLEHLGASEHLSVRVRPASELRLRVRDHAVLRPQRRYNHSVCAAVLGGEAPTGESPARHRNPHDDATRDTTHQGGCHLL